MRLIKTIILSRAFMYLFAYLIIYNLFAQDLVQAFIDLYGQIYKYTKNLEWDLGYYAFFKHASIVMILLSIALVEGFLLAYDFFTFDLETDFMKRIYIAQGAARCVRENNAYDGLISIENSFFQLGKDLKSGKVDNHTYHAEVRNLLSEVEKTEQYIEQSTLKKLIKNQ